MGSRSSLCLAINLSDEFKNMQYKTSNETFVMVECLIFFFYIFCTNNFSPFNMKIFCHIFSGLYSMTFQCHLFQLSGFLFGPSISISFYVFFKMCMKEGNAKFQTCAKSLLFSQTFWSYFWRNSSGSSYFETYGTLG